ncbi:MAG: hypothetical protein AAF716_09455 [Cyanobacteria bacterium P01_D01_bin.1]
MVSQPQTWKHPEPKALWPTLGGLAVLLHVGILGFSLPYLIEIMRPTAANSDTAIPIELIVEAGSTPETPPISQQLPDSVAAPVAASTDSPQTTEAPIQPADSQAPESAETNAAATATEALTSQTESIVSSTQSQSEAVQNPVRPESDSSNADLPTDKPDASESESVDSDSQTSNSQTSDSQTSATTEPEADSQNPQDVSDLPNDLADEEKLPELPGDQAIPTPGSEAASSDLPQVAYLRVVGYQEVPRSLQRDLVTQPPSPVDAELAEIELRPRDVDCTQLDFPQPQVTYRITVNTDGSMRAAFPWTGSIEERPPLTEQESAIACLLLASGFRFTPATIEGEPVVNDNLLLTLDIIESQAN